MRRVEKSQAATRSRPMSCTFCRSRKLRCSRNFPCTNCISRSLDCPHDGSLPSQPDRSAEIPIQTSTSYGTDVLARLRRLEEIVIGQGRTPPVASNGIPIHVGTPSSHASPSSFGSLAQNFDRSKRSDGSPSSDVEWLEGEITQPTPTVRNPDHVWHDDQSSLTRCMAIDDSDSIRD